MNKQQVLYSGKAKTVYQTDDKDLLVIEFRNDTSAFDGAKVAQFERKGMVNNYFNAFIMQKLAEQGIKTHFVKIISPQDAVFKRLEMIPVECVVRNVAAGGISKRLGLQEGMELNPPVFEFFLKNDALHDPMINGSHIRTFNWATPQEVETMKEQSFKVNEILLPLFKAAGLTLVDYKLEFGRLNGEVILGDEFTPDGCRLWDCETKEKFDKDRFRRDLGSMVEYYEQAARRLGVVLP